MKKFFTKKKIIWTVIIVLIAGPIIYNLAKGKDPSKNIQTDTVKKQDIKRTVLATGQVVSKTDLSLSFKAGGIVQKVNVKEGDKVKQGDMLAQLSQKDQLASLTSAQGAYAQARANYNKVLAGASSEDVRVTQAAVDAAQVSVDNAKRTLDTTKKQQDVLVANAFSAVLNSTLAVVADTNNPDSVVPTVSGSYSGIEQGVYQISVYSGGGGLRFKVNGLEDSDGLIDTIPQTMGKKGLFLQFSTKTVSIFDRWTIVIPNIQAPNYTTNYNAYQAAVQARDVAVNNAQSTLDTAQATLSQQQASLALKQSQARPADVEAAQAGIISASGQVQAAQSALENTVIRAPVDGVVTQVEVKVGEQATAMKEAVVLQDVGNVHIEANVSEANIADVKNDQSVDLTFDALGPDRHFSGKVQTVDPASTVVSGVVNYKVTASMDKLDEVKPGMTANMTILTSEKSSVLTVPSRAVISRDNKKFIKVIDNTKKKTYHEEEIKTGMEADGGVVEVVSGLSEGQEVVTYIKK